MRNSLILAVGLALLIPGVTMADTITGKATVIDGDTIKINGREIGLVYIDAPELGQVCYDKLFRNAKERGNQSPEPFDGGARVKGALVELISDQVVTCEFLIDIAEFAVCSTPTHKSLNLTMAEKGLVFPFPPVMYESQHKDRRGREIRSAIAKFRYKKQHGLYTKNGIKCQDPRTIRNDGSRQ